MAESINGLYKAAVIHRKSGKNRAEAELWQRWRGGTGTTIAGGWKGWSISHRQKPDRPVMLPSGIRLWQPEFPTKILSRKTGAVHNPFGVMDHWIDSGSGKEIYVPMRVIANEQGAEVMVTVYRQPFTSDEKFKQDIEWVSNDLEKLNQLLTQ